MFGPFSVLHEPPGDCAVVLVRKFLLTREQSDRIDREDPAVSYRQQHV